MRWSMIIHLILYINRYSQKYNFNFTCSHFVLYNKRVRSKGERFMLTLREKATYEFIQYYIDTNKHSPTAAEIAEHLKIQSRGVVHRYIKALSDKGYITLVKGKWRNIELKQHPLATSIPILGAIAAGQPIEAVTDNQFLDMQEIFVGQGRYALRVKGDSMIDEGIHDGDIVICRHTKNAVNGQIVVALVDSESATLKRIQWHEDQTISLVPANSTYKTQRYPNARVEIQGIFIGLLRMSK